MFLDTDVVSGAGQLLQTKVLHPSWEAAELQPPHSNGLLAAWFWLPLNGRAPWHVEGEGDSRVWGAPRASSRDSDLLLTWLLKHD